MGISRKCSLPHGFVPTIRLGECDARRTYDTASRWYLHAVQCEDMTVVLRLGSVVKSQRCGSQHVFVLAVLKRALPIALSNDAPIHTCHALFLCTDSQGVSEPTSLSDLKRLGGRHAMVWCDEIKSHHKDHGRNAGQDRKTCEKDHDRKVGCISRGAASSAPFAVHHIEPVLNTLAVVSWQSTRCAFCHLDFIFPLSVCSPPKRRCWKHEQRVACAF